MKKNLFFVLTLIVCSQEASAQVTVESNAITSTSQFLGSTTAFDVLFKSSGTEYMRLKTTGFLGIGTQTPDAKLHLHNGVLRLTGPNSAGGPQMILGGTPGGSAPHGVWGIEYTTAVPGREGLNFWKPFLATGGSGNYFMFLSNSGKVGINTDNPTAQLTVNGNMLIGDPSVVCIPNTNYKLFVQTGILTEKVRVAINCSANWADYVFASDYKLMPLPELEKYVTENKHLPNIPSAEQVVSEGMDVGQMTAKLLEKVEEMSLYIIEQNKKLEALEAKVELLQK